MSRRDRGPPNTEGMISLKVDNLTYRTTPEMLKRVFEKYGDVGDVYIPRDPYSQESRGFAFVRYYDDRDADDAIDGLNGTLLDGRELRVQLAKHARPPQSSSNSRRSGPSSSRRGDRRSHSRSRSRDRGRHRHSRSRSHSRSHRRSDRRSRSHSQQRSRSAGRKSGDRRSRSRSGQNGRGKSTSKSPERPDGSGGRQLNKSPSPSGGDRRMPPNDDVANNQYGRSRSRSPAD